MVQKQTNGSKKTVNKRLIIPALMALLVSYEFTTYSNSLSIGLSVLLVQLAMLYLAYTYGVKAGVQNYLAEGKKQKNKKIKK